jgi:hypothetical protein
LAEQYQSELYAEELEFREMRGGRRVILPSDLDVALKQIGIGRLDQNLQRLREEPMPSEVKLAIDDVDEGIITESKKERLKATIRDWESQRIADQRAMFSALHSQKAEMGEMLRLMGVALPTEWGEDALVGPGPLIDLGGEPVSEFYGMREIIAEKRYWADDEFSRLDSKTNERNLDTGKRNVWLLGWVLLWKREARGPQIAECRRLLEMGELDRLKEGAEVYTRDSTQDRMDPGKIQDTRARVLIDRMWARNSMDPQLEVYFRGGGLPVS